MKWPARFEIAATEGDPHIVAATSLEAGHALVRPTSTPSMRLARFASRGPRIQLDALETCPVAAVHDSGRILNPIGASGRVYGGVVMSIGQALTEGTQLDEAGRQSNPHLLDYKLPTASDAPRIDIAWVETPALDGGPDGFYRQAMAAVITRRAIEFAAARARGEDVPIPANAVSTA